MLILVMMLGFCENCDLWDHGFTWGGASHLIGDAAYPLQRCLITQYRDNHHGHSTAEQKAFSFALSSTRVTAERAFGLLTGPFPRLQYVNTRKIKTTADIIMCSVHNSSKYMPCEL